MLKLLGQNLGKCGNQEGKIVHTTIFAHKGICTYEEVAVNRTGDLVASQKDSD